MNLKIVAYPLWAIIFISIHFYRHSNKVNSINKNNKVIKIKINFYLADLMNDFYYKFVHQQIIIIIFLKKFNLKNKQKVWPCFIELKWKWIKSIIKPWPWESTIFLFSSWNQMIYGNTVQRTHVPNSRTFRSHRVFFVSTSWAMEEIWCWSVEPHQSNT